MVLDLEKYKLHREMHLSSNTKAIDENTRQFHSLEYTANKYCTEYYLAVLLKRCNLKSQQVNQKFFEFKKGEYRDRQHA